MIIQYFNETCKNITIKNNSDLHQHEHATYGTKKRFRSTIKQS